MDERQPQPAERRLSPAAPQLGLVHMAQREVTVRRFHGTLTHSAVVVSIFEDEAGELQVLLSTRSAVNGRTGRPMRNANEVVLFGGRVDEGESALAAALRELSEETSPIDPETGLSYAHLQDKKPLALENARPVAWLGRWFTENGFEVDGFLVFLPERVRVESLGFNPGEVSEVFAVPVRFLFENPFLIKARPIAGMNRELKILFEGMFESTSLTYRDPRTGVERELWGAAGHMLQQLVELYHGRYELLRGELLGPVERRRAGPAVGAPHRAPEEERRVHVRQAHEALDFMRWVMEIPPPPLVEAPGLSALLGERALLQLEACLPLGHSSKVRNMAGLACRIARNALATRLVEVEARLAKHPHAEAYPLRQKAALGVALDGATLVAASTGSHARAVAEFGRWLEAEGLARVRVELFVSQDIGRDKLAALAALGATITRGGGFTELTRQAIRHVREKVRAGERCLFIPTDPIDTPSPDGSFNWKDGMRGFATLAMDTLSFLERKHAEGALARPDADALYLATSGGATWAACSAYLYETRRSGALSRSPGTIGSVVAVGDENAMPVYASLKTGRLVDDYPIPEGAPPINGLTQRDMSPYAFELAREIVPHPDEAVRATSLTACKLGQLLILGDTGVLPEAAGAASVGGRLQEAISALGGEEMALRLSAALRGLGFARGDVQRMGVTPEDLASAGLVAERFYSGLERAVAEPAGTRSGDARLVVYTVSGAHVEQRIAPIARKLTQALEQGLVEGGRVSEGGLDLLYCLAHVLPLCPAEEKALLANEPDAPELKGLLSAVRTFAELEPTGAGPRSLQRERALKVRYLHARLSALGLLATASRVDETPASE